MRGPLLVIVGPTAVGKTSLSLSLAGAFRGEIVSGDSMQVYRHMDIGTAKVTAEEREKIPHHLIDIVDPDHPFTVEEYQRLAREAIEDIQRRGRLPILVGGTGLYIQSVTHGYLLPGVEGNPELREKLHRFADEEGNEKLWEKLKAVDPETAVRLHPNDRRRIIRALEVYEGTGIPFSKLQRKSSPRYDMLWIGLTMSRERLYERINRRVDRMMAEGLVEEVEALRNKGYHRDLTSMQALGYKEIMMYLDGEISREEAVEAIKRGTRKYAKRQLSWFRRIPEIHWFDVNKPESAEEIWELAAGKFPAYKE
ncbi:MAG: tRNA (adenosine(37)-N6)-dimethylallyltransferase MiaA [Planifilum fimeticola]